MSESDPSLKIVYLTAGAGGMYCGSCLRDNALVAGLQDLGWDATLLPLYTPIRVDDDDHSIDHIFFGGINVYLQQKIPLFRHLPKFFDRWLDNPRLIQRVAAKSMSMNPKDLGAMTLSMVKGEDGFQKREVDKLVTWFREVAKPDLICLTNLLVGGSIPALKRELNDVPIVVTLQGDDLFLDELQEPWRKQVLSEMRKLASQADGFITFSQYYRDAMIELLEIPAEKFHLTPLGINVSEFDEVWAFRKQEANKNTIGYFARICPEKGFDLLIDAFLILAKNHPDVVLKAGGWLSEKDQPFLAEQINKIRAAGLEDRFDYIGSPDGEGKKAFLKKIDLFCVPARFLEPKGLYLLEAMACGIPVVAPDKGAFPEIVNASGAGVLFEGENITDLAEKLAAFFENEIANKSQGENGRKWVAENNDQAAMAKGTAKVFQSLTKQG